MDKLIAPANWLSDPQWFADVSSAARGRFAREFCDRLFEHEGQACVVISYPRANTLVAFYDLDGGRCGVVRLSTVALAPKLRETEEDDFTFSEVMSSDVCDEAMDISNQLF
jgi:hypothetical protein